MIDALVTLLILVSAISERPDVKQLSGVSDTIINGCVAVILGFNRKIVGDLTVSFCLLEGRLC
jgi:hypothetical protein